MGSSKLLFYCPEMLPRYSAEHKHHLARVNAAFFPTLSFPGMHGFSELCMNLCDAGRSGLPAFGPAGLRGAVWATAPVLWRPQFTLEVTEFHGSGWLPSVRVGDLEVVPFAAGEDAPARAETSQIGLDFSVRYSNLVRLRRAHLTRRRLAFLVLEPPKRGAFDAAKARALGLKGAEIGRLTRGQTLTLRDGTELDPSEFFAAPRRPRGTLVLPPGDCRNFAEISRDPRVAAVVCAGRTCAPPPDAWRAPVPRARAPLPSAHALMRALRAGDGAALFPALAEEHFESTAAIAVASEDEVGRVAPVGVVVGCFSPSSSPPSSSSAAPPASPPPFAWDAVPAPTLIPLGTNAGCFDRYRGEAAYLLLLPTARGVRAALFDCGAGTLTQLWRLFGARALPALLGRIRLVSVSHRHGDHCIGLATLLRAVAEARGLQEKEEEEEEEQEEEQEKKKKKKNKNKKTGITCADCSCELTLEATLRCHRMVHTTWDMPEEAPGAVLARAHALPAPPGDRVLLISSFWIDAWIRQLRALGQELPVHFVDAGDLREGAPEGSPLQRFLAEEVGIDNLRTCEQLHTFPTFGVVLWERGGPQGGAPLLAFSADTRPNPRFAEAARGVRFLLHETTFDTNEQDREKAQSDRHCTWEDAMQVRDMAAAETLLCTHLSSRMNGFPAFPGNVPPAGVAVCFDFMVLPLVEGAGQRAHEHTKFLMKNGEVHSLFSR